MLCDVRCVMKDVGRIRLTNDVADGRRREGVKEGGVKREVCTYPAKEHRNRERGNDS